MSDYAIITSEADLRLALRKRNDELNVSLETIETLSGLSRGYATKILGVPKPKKRACLQTNLWLLRSLGLKLALQIDHEAFARLKDRYVQRHLRRLMCPPSPDTPAA